MPSQRFHKFHASNDVKLVNLGETYQVSPKVAMNQRVIGVWNLWNLFPNLIVYEHFFNHESALQLLEFQYGVPIV